MASPAEEQIPEPEDYLRLALLAPTAGKRARFARAGLEANGEAAAPDTQVLLMRQLYLAHLERDELGQAARTARRMAEIGPLKDVAHHDAARALAAIGEMDEAIGEQRLAARSAPAARRSFQLWSLATLQHFAGDHESALATLARATRWAQRDALLLEAHAAYVELDMGRMPEGLATLLDDLQKSKAREGYGRFLLGMISYQVSDRRGAITHLRAFLRRNAGADRPKRLTLQVELKRAREALADLESD